jgi:hypothetical protein
LKNPVISSQIEPASFPLSTSTNYATACFQDVEDIKDKKIVTAELNAVPLEAFADCFQKLFERSHKCIQVGGDCFK